MPILIIRSIMPGTPAINGAPSRTGHAWLEVVSPGAPSESFGFYPEGASPYIPGALHHRSFTLSSPCAFSHELDSACCNAGVLAMCQ